MTVVQPNSIAGINSISVQSGQSLSIHKSDGTLIREIVASTGISTYSSISVGSATTTNNANKSINIGLGASISQHADNSLSFGTNGDERVLINSSGYMGIGAASPSYALMIQGAGNAASGIYLYNNTGAEGIKIVPESNGNCRIYASTNDALCIGTNDTDRITIDADGGNTTFTSNLTIPDKIIHSGDTDTAIRFPSANEISFETTGVEGVRIDSQGRLLIGVTASTPTDNDANNVALQVEGTAGNDERAMIRANNTTAGNGPFLYFARSRGTSLASKTSVSDGDSLGGLVFNGADGSDDTRAASIQAFCDGTPGTDDMPGRLVFSTTPDGAGNYTERLRITSSGFVGIGEDTPVCKLDVDGGARFQSANTDKHQDGCIIERNSGDGLVHITAGRASGNYSGFNFYVAGDVGGSGANAKLRHQIDYQGNFKWYDSDGSTMRMHINTSGRIGIKTTGDLNGALLAIGVGQGSNTPSGEHIKIAPSANTISFLDSASNTSDTANIEFWNTVYNNSSAKIEFYRPAGNLGAIKIHTHSGSGLVERMRLFHNGMITMQGTSSDMNEAANKGFTYSYHATSPYIRVKHEGKGVNYANHTLIHFVGSNAMIGEIKQDGDGTITYATSSDYRLKENIVDLTGAITRLKNLKPKRFNFKENSGLTKDGFLAHELQEVIPESVNGTKDEVVTADSKVNNPVLADMELGVPVYQTADASRVVPLLTAALQEAITKIETLETKVAALESS